MSARVDVRVSHKTEIFRYFISIFKFESELKHERGIFDNCHKATAEGKKLDVNIIEEKSVEEHNSEFNNFKVCLLARVKCSNPVL